MDIKKADLIVVGGGILGTFHALHALKKGLKVLQIEKDNFPVGSTVRNFGQVVPSGMADRWFNFGVKGLEIYQDIQSKTDIGIRNNGSIYIASDNDEVQIIHELSKHYKTKGYDHEIWTKEMILKKYPDLRPEYIKEAIFFPQELSAEPEFMIKKIHEYLAVQYPNYSLLYDTAIIGCEENENAVVLHSSRNEKFIADQVVICNGYEFKILFKELFDDSGLQISKLQMMKTKPLSNIKLPGNILTGLTIRRYESFEENCPSFNSIELPEHYHELKANGIHILFKQGIDGSIIVGDSHEYSKGNRIDELGFSINSHINRLMIQEANRILPLSEDLITSSWAGFYSQHANQILEIDLTEKIHIRTGIGGKGMTASAGYALESINKIL
ncbi:TIGR03364 family FAD-dependent oxidoreductase [Sphingobacterium cellulitidis]|uniref:TIGR03364 family FAD-dependent oxidoreductase n=1 Tax=Sphingobacterium cellulitidis TaxID=1768011 RepID=UPI000B93EF77|nr:TIGR03364 family FAD-dependent oxidoreductase [Sphingobacterium cellulitidis]OYD45077.1 TIGR03364 family FAD-dependent oxidoreductase [Sphingobacterium cellulitidis]